MSQDKRLYKVTFMQQGDVYEIFANYVGQSDLMGFIEVEEVVFGETTAVLVDPSEERLKQEFEGVKCSFIPMHAVLRIDEVEKRGNNKISEAKGKPVSNVSQFPGPLFTPKTD